MINAEEARQRQYNIQKQKEQAQIEFDAKHTYLDENGEKQYYSLESFEDIMDMIVECCKSCEDTSVEVRNKLHPDTVKSLKEVGYRIFLANYEIYDLRPNINEYGKRIYERVTFNCVYTVISWGGIPKGFKRIEEI